MKDEGFTEIVCRGFCSYYKPGKEELHCGGYEVLRRCCTPDEVRAAAGLLETGDDIKCVIPPEDSSLKEFLCAQCDFAVDGCDYSDNRSGPPCGGYILINLLTK